MKLLAISDTHGKLSNAQSVISRLNGKISAVLHLGDMFSDAQILEAENDGLAFHYIAGNCDFYYSAEPGMKERTVIEYNGTRIYLTHGHLEGVKRGYGTIAEAAKKAGAVVAVCGHTHSPFSESVDGVLCVNPGSIALPRGYPRVPSYAVIDIPDANEGKPSAGIVYFRQST